ncbi:uncharacterized protein LOC129771560 [Toxorhynchites rutilus septentrionalis]|uniref:uncharacterized protein LOC129771560 n=1 Tax=Toxorhynchites rutilus septentrionalis TaxID=329112 RepID=UPI00247913E9|nr:uncharacterized protein LOC129771560 [Toxorhynchites rutilus septentrionalis]
MVRTASVVSTEPLSILQAESRGSLRKGCLVTAGAVLKARKISSNTSTPDLNDPNSDSSHSNGHITTGISNARVMLSLDDINKKLEEHSKKLSKLQLDMDKIHWAPRMNTGRDGGLLGFSGMRAIVFAVLGLLLQVVIAWFFTKRSLASVASPPTGGAPPDNGDASQGGSSVG